MAKTRKSGTQSSPKSSQSRPVRQVVRPPIAKQLAAQPLKAGPKRCGVVTVPHLTKRTRADALGLYEAPADGPTPIYDAVRDDLDQ